MEYKIVYGETMLALENEVKDYIKLGWIPQGGVAIHLGVMYQVMVKQ
ncbi:hypothetical protein [Glaciecola sp. 1036]